MWCATVGTGDAEESGCSRAARAYSVASARVRAVQADRCAGERERCRVVGGRATGFVVYDRVAAVGASILPTIQRRLRGAA